MKKPIIILSLKLKIKIGFFIKSKVRFGQDFIREYIQFSNRNQWEFYCLEETLDAEHPARFIEAFVDKLELQALRFVPKPIQKEGRTAFDHKVFLKLYLSGFLNGIRSSRLLEKECARSCMSDPLVQWCERRTPLVYSDGAAYSITGCSFWGVFY